MKRPVRESSPCLRHGCSACCHETAMTLTDADVQRIEQAGHAGFCTAGADGSLVLRNVGGRCVFLVETGCSVYAVRPEGCTLYPLVLEIPGDRIVLDDVCPYRHEFTFTQSDRARLLASIAREEADARRRRRSSESGSGRLG